MSRDLIKDMVVKAIRGGAAECIRHQSDEDWRIAVEVKVEEKLPAFRILAATGGEALSEEMEKLAKKIGS